MGFSKLIAYGFPLNNNCSSNCSTTWPEERLEKAIMKQEEYDDKVQRNKNHVQIAQVNLANAEEAAAQQR